MRIWVSQDVYYGQKEVKMKSTLQRKILFWTPRALATLYILFISMFALDVFGEYEKIGQILVALFMHLIPTFILIACLIVAWKKPLIGGIIFIALGLGFTLFFKTYKEFFSFLLITFPLLAIGTLFIIDQKMRK